MTDAVGTMPAEVEPVAPSAPAGAVRTVMLALLGLGLGVGVALGTMAPVRPNPFATLPAAAEPAASRDVAAALAAEDARQLGQALDRQQLQALGTAIQPVFTIYGVKFLGAVERQGETLAAYSLQGKTNDGSDVGVGFVLHVANDKVVGVN